MAELADFDPTTGHLHSCQRLIKGVCASGCIELLFVVAQDAEIRQAQLLTPLQREIIDDAGALWTKICRAVPDGPSRTGDLDELIKPVHLIQRYFMAEAATAAYPGQYRPLGLAIDIRRRGPQIGETP